MNRSTLKFVIDAIAFVVFVLLTATGVLMRYVLPPGSGRFSTLWGMDRHQWGALHFWTAVALFIILGVHLILHWRWIVSVVQGTPREESGVRVALSLVGLLALAGLAIAPFISPVEHLGEPQHKLRSLKHEEAQEPLIFGSMTIREVSEAEGISSEEIVRTLKLPPETDIDERLGRLRRIHGFEIHDVRKLVQNHGRQ